MQTIKLRKGLDIPLPSTSVYIWGLSMRSSFLSKSIISAQHWGLQRKPRMFAMGESGGTIPSDRALGQRSRPYQLAEWFDLCDLVAEREACIFFDLYLRCGNKNNH